MGFIRLDRHGNQSSENAGDGSQVRLVPDGSWGKILLETPSPIHQRRSILVKGTELNGLRIQVLAYRTEGIELVGGALPSGGVNESPPLLLKAGPKSILLRPDDQDIRLPGNRVLTF